MHRLDCENFIAKCSTEVLSPGTLHREEEL